MDQVIDTNIVQSLGDGHPQGQVSTTHSGLGTQLRNSVRELLGDRVQLQQLMSSGNLDYHESSAHTTTSLPYAIHGKKKIKKNHMSSRIIS